MKMRGWGGSRVQTTVYAVVWTIGTRYMYFFVFFFFSANRYFVIVILYVLIMKCTWRKERAGGDEQMAGLETRPAGKFSFPFFTVLLF